MNQISEFFSSPIQKLRALNPRVQTVPPENIAEPFTFGDQDIDLLKNISLTQQQLRDQMNASTRINYERTNIYREVDRAIQHWMVGCLRGSTKIRLCDGSTHTISHMTNHEAAFIGKYVWSVNPDTLQMEPDEIVAATLTRKNAEMVRVVLDNGEQIDCTPDHKFMMRDGSYIEAQNLESGNSLMPFYSKLCGKGPLASYEIIYNPAKKKYQYGHRLAVEDQWENYPQRRGYVVHHDDFIKTNNDPSNLRIMEKSKHSQYHGRIAARKHDRETCQRKYQAKRKAALLNHKVASVTFITEREDVYDLSTAKNHNFSLASGIIVHNSACELYADYATTFNHIQNATVWINSDSKKYTNNLTAFLETIGVEEKINDWAWTLAAYGDMFCGCEGAPGIGIVNIDDNQHPANISRVDYKGVLIGFYRTPFEVGAGGMGQTSDVDLLPPWDWVHFRTLGAKKKRPLYGDPSFAEYRAVHLMGPDTKVITSKYGTSMLINGLPIYKRLRLAEDSVLLARLTRGIMKYIYKVKVAGGNAEATGKIIAEYMRILKRARALNTDPNNPNYDSKSNPMSSVEDLFIPVWGDVGDVSVEKIGGEADIRWIVDVDALRNQLASALRCPLALLGGFVKEASGSLGSEAISQLDIRFARSSRKVQRALKTGITRLCQIHLAYQNMDPDPALFEVCMSETSTAEEAELRDSLEKSVSAVDTFMEMADRMMEGTGKRLDKVELLDYFNKKVIKLNDLHIEDYIIDEEPLLAEPGSDAPGSTPSLPSIPGPSDPAGADAAGEMTIGSDKPGEPGNMEGEKTIGGMRPDERRSILVSKATTMRHIAEQKLAESYHMKRSRAAGSMDLIAALPLGPTAQVAGFITERSWKKLWEGKKVRTQFTDTVKNEKRLRESKTSKKRKAAAAGSKQDKRNAAMALAGVVEPQPPETNSDERKY